MGGVASASAPSAVSADGDAVNLWITRTGVLQIGDAGGSLTVDGSVTCNSGTNLNTSALALESGGNLAGAATSLAVIDDWDESDRAKVNPISGQVGVQGGSGVVTNTTQRVVLATDVALPAGTNAIGKLAANSGVDIGDVDVTSIAAGNNNIGDVDVASIAAGNNNIGDVDVASIAAGTNTIGGVRLKPDTSGGLTIYKNIDLDEADQAVKASAGQVYGWYLFNAAASTRYLKLYNASTASTTVGTTTPVMTIPIPAGSAANVEFSIGIAFSTAITAACTTDLDEDGSPGAPSANDCITNIFYN